MSDAQDNAAPKPAPEHASPLAAGKQQTAPASKPVPDDTSCCKDASPRVSGPRMVEVALLDGGALYVELREYCRGCRLVLSPKTHGRVSVATADADARMDAAIQQSPQALNKPGAAAAAELGLLPWDDVVEVCGASRILKSTLWGITRRSVTAPCAWAAWATS